MPNQKLKVYCDGGHNSGRCSCATVIYLNKKLLMSDAEAFMGTNNIAEYRGLLLGLNTVKNKIRTPDRCDLELFLDSKLIVEQVNGNWHCKEDHLRVLRDKALELIRELRGFYKNVSVSWIPREQNSNADSLCQAQLLIRTAYPK